ncbi:hypothetical protein [Roseisolibacter sp. H3M3-2]|uniref:hypothetical protein n=1 Tax=Roseisolibacter sp. H3M3-2 TaxID=3031323 RepID=UPI0023DA40D4|nr:hypothetical protein [Roseisolibacter sp. H3M3-2]MDF1501454.1 hypothetical protein [Roseisolibacter sp. H3M3-2]
MPQIRPHPRARLTAALLALAALAVPAADAAAQTCTGAASFNRNPVRVGGLLATGDDVTTLGADILFGEPGGAFGGVGVALDDFDDDVFESSTTIQGTLGYQVPIGTGARRPGGGPQFCPIATLGYSLGPDFRLGGTDYESRTLGASAGFSVGAPIGLSPTVNLVPFGGLRLIYARTTVSVEGSDVDDTDSDSFGALDLGAGLTFNDRFTVRPAFAVPLNRDGADTRFSLLFALHFGGQ